MLAMAAVGRQVQHCCDWCLDSYPGLNVRIQALAKSSMLGMQTICMRFNIMNSEARNQMLQPISCSMTNHVQDKAQVFNLMPAAAKQGPES